MNKRNIFINLFYVLFALMCIISVSQVAHKATRGRSAFVRWIADTEKIDQGETVYHQADFDPKGRWMEEGFPYMPIMALILKPFHKLGAVAGSVVWGLLKCGVLFWIIWGVKLFWDDRRNGVMPAWLPLILLFFSTYVFSADLTHGNINILIGGLIITALVCSRCRRDFMAGFVIGLAVILKVTPVLFGLYFLYKRRWKSLLGIAVAGLVFGFLIPSIVLGFRFNWDLTLGWYDQMIGPFLHGRPENMKPVIYFNQSFFGVFHRLFTDSVAIPMYTHGRVDDFKINFLSLNGRSISLILKSIYIVIIGVMLAAARTQRVNRRSIGNLGEFALVFLAMLFISERSWKHHYILLILPHFFIIEYCITTKLKGWRKWLPACLLLGSIVCHLFSADGFIGKNLSDLAEAYGVFLIGGVFLFIACTLILWFRRNNYANLEVMESGNYDTKTFSKDGIIWTVPADCLDRVQQWMDSYFPAIFEKRDALLKDDKGSRVAHADGLVIKESTARKGRSVLRFGLRRSGSARAFRLGSDLVSCAVKTPRPIAWATIRSCGLRKKEYLITEEVVESHLLTKNLKSGDDREKVLSLLGSLLASFHSNAFSNRDMKDTNILVTENNEFKLWYVDLDGVKKKLIVSKWRAARDFWPIVRSLRRCGWNTDVDNDILLKSYNDSVPERLRFDKLPGFNRLDSRDIS